MLTFKEYTEVNEEPVRPNHREFATAGKMHPSFLDALSHAGFPAKKGETLDFYGQGTGNKITGKLTHDVDNKTKVIKIKAEKWAGGKLHTFNVSRHLHDEPTYNQSRAAYDSYMHEGNESDECTMDEETSSITFTDPTSIHLHSRQKTKTGEYRIHKADWLSDDDARPGQKRFRHVLKVKGKPDRTEWSAYKDTPDSMWKEVHESNIQEDTVGIHPAGTKVWARVKMGSSNSASVPGHVIRHDKARKMYIVDRGWRHSKADVPEDKLVIREDTDEKDKPAPKPDFKKKFAERLALAARERARQRRGTWRNSKEYEPDEYGRPDDK